MFKHERNVFTGATPYNETSIYYMTVDYGVMNPFAVGLVSLRMKVRYGRSEKSIILAEKQVRL